MVASAGNFFERCKTVFSNTNNIFEGVFWSSWCALNVYGWNYAVSQRQKLDGTPETLEKAERIWKSNKEVLMSSCSVVAGISMVTSWVSQVGLIPLGKIAVYISSMGYGGSFTVSSIRLWDVLKEINQGILAYNETVDPRAKSQIALQQIHNLFRVAFYTCIAAWGIFGSIYALVGGTALFAIVDTFFYYATIFFFILLGSSILLPAPPKDKTLVQ